MFLTPVRRNQPSVKNKAFGMRIPTELYPHRWETVSITYEDKKRYFKEIYDFAVNMADDIARIEIESTATVDEAIILISQALYDYFEIEVYISDCVQMGIQIPLSGYAGNTIPARAFLDRRKDKAFTKFLFELLANLMKKGLSIFNNYMWEMMEDSVEDQADSYKGSEEDKDVETFYYLAVKEKYKLLEPFKAEIMRLIRKKRWFEHNPKLVAYWCLKYPEWEKFIEDALAVLKLEYYYHHFPTLNINFEADYDYVCYHDSYSFIWSKESNISQEVCQYLQMGWENNDLMAPYYPINHKKLYQNPIKLQEKASNHRLMLELFENYYECFDKYR